MVITSQNYQDATVNITVTLVDKIVVLVNGVTVADKVYDGKAPTPGGEASFFPEYPAGELEYTWYRVEEGRKTLLHSAPRSVGSYVLRAAISETQAAYTGRQDVSFSITPATVTITAEDKSVNTLQSEPIYTYTVSGLAKGESLKTEPTVAGVDVDIKKVGTYVIKAQGAQLPEATAENYLPIVYVDGTLTVTRGYVGDNVPSTNSQSTTTVKNEDGTTTKIVTNKRTGTVTETTTAKDGTKTVVETTKDGTVTTTVTDRKGGKVTVVTKDEITTITLSGGKAQAVVELPVQVRPGTVAVIVKPDGSEEILKTSVPTKEGIKLLVGQNAAIRFKDNAKTFRDIPADYWAKDAIDFVSARGIFKGTSEVTFAPTMKVDRAMMATLLFRLAEGTAQGKSPFADVAEDTWYTDAVIWANANGIVTGYDSSTFAPTDPVTREQMAVMFYRYAKLLKMDTAAEGDISKYTDMAASSDWAVEAMAWCVGTGLMNGTSDTTLSPGESTSRAEVATMLMRIVELMVK